MHAMWPWSRPGRDVHLATTERSKRIVDRNLRRLDLGTGIPLLECLDDPRNLRDTRIHERVEPKPRSPAPRVAREVDALVMQRTTTGSSPTAESLDPYEG